MDKTELKELTQKDEVLMYMKKYGNISTIEASNKLYIADLQSVIRMIKKERNIATRWIYKKNKFDRPCRFKRYYFAKTDNMPWWKRVRFFM